MLYKFHFLFYHEKEMSLPSEKKMIFIAIVFPRVRETMDISPAPGILTHNSVIVLTW